MRLDPRNLMRHNPAVALLIVACAGCSSNPVSPKPPATEPYIRVAEVFIDNHFSSATPSFGDLSWFSPRKPARGQHGAPADLRGADSASIDVPIEAVATLVACGSYPQLRVALRINGVAMHDTTISFVTGTSPETRKLSLGYWAPPDTGHYFLEVVADPDSVYPERDKANNVASLGLGVTWGDLGPEYLHITIGSSTTPACQDSVHVGDSLTVSATVSGRGAYPLIPVRITLDNVVVADTTLAGVTDVWGRCSATLKVPWVPAWPGTHWFNFEVDPAGTLHETTRDNNVTPKYSQYLDVYP